MYDYGKYEVLNTFDVDEPRYFNVGDLITANMDMSADGSATDMDESRRA
jgi:hypothetical protein